MKRNLYTILKNIKYCIYLILLSSCFSYINAQEEMINRLLGAPNCEALQRFRTGVFRYGNKDERFKALTVFRGEEGQVEMNESSNTYLVASLRYLPNCRYQIEIVNTSLGNDQGNKIIGFQTVYKVVNYTENSFSVVVEKCSKNGKPIKLKDPDMIITLIKTEELKK